MKSKYFKNFLRYLYPFKTSFFLIIFLCILSAVLSLLSPLIIGNVIDSAIGYENVNFKLVFSHLIYLLGISLVGSVLQWGVSFYSGKLSIKVTNNIRNSFFSKINNIPIKYMDTHSHGDIISRAVNDIDTISEGLIQCIDKLFSGSSIIFFTVLFMFNISFKVTLLVLVLAPLAIFISTRISRASYSQFRKYSSVQGDLTGYTEEFISNQKAVKLFSYEGRSIENFEKINSKLFKFGVKSQFISSLTNPSTRFITNFIYILVGVFGAYICVKDGSISIGQISSLLIYVNQFNRPFVEIAAVVTQLQAALASINRIFEVLDKQSESENSDAMTKLPSKVVGNVDIENLYFSYNENSKMIINNMNLNIKPGQKIAIIGPTGCGKTTVINLLMRFYDVNSGDIKIDNISIKGVPRKDLRDIFGMVLQDTWLCNASIKDNISYGNPKASDQEIISAAKLAKCDHFIRRLKNGYDTLVSEDTISMSEGQKQLLCIARVILKNPSILILDEATSNIDTRTEINIQKAIDNMAEGKTCFIIAHRLSTIKNADMIVVMDKGCIVEKGNHKELLKKNGFYAKLYYSQYA